MIAINKRREREKAAKTVTSLHIIAFRVYQLPLVYLKNKQMVYKT